MKPFVRSSCESFKSTTYAVTVRNSTTAAPVEGKTNHPIPVHHLFTFYPSFSPATQIHEGNLYYPTIVFNFVCHNPPKTWYYPPTEDGEKQRDADLQALYDTITYKCPDE